MKLLLVSILMVVVSQVFPSCGQDQSANVLVGYIEAKRFDRPDGAFMLVINGHEYVAPFSFWQTVKVDDLVRWDGTTWTIVRRGSS